jgi:hypothetical protein
MLDSARVIAFAATSRPKAALDFHCNVLGLPVIGDP